MKNTSGTDETDILLNSAVPYIENRELEIYEKAADIPAELSEKEKKRILSEILRGAEPSKRRMPYSIKENLGRVAVAAVSVISICFIGTIGIEAVRVTIFDAIVKWYENSIFVAYESSDEVTSPNKIIEHREPVLGEEYTRYEIENNEHTYIIEYESEEFLIVYGQNLLESYDTLISNNDTVITDITVNGYSGIVTVSETHGMTDTVVIWHDYEYVYTLSGNLSCDELISIAETVQ